VAAPRLAERLGVRTVWIKDESRNPTWSFKDRSASVAASHARLLGSPALVVSSTGNAAAAAAAYARRAGLPAIVLVAKSVDPIMSAFVRSYGAYVVATPTKADRWVLMRHCVEAWGCYPAGSFANPPVGGNPYMMDGYKTIGYEIWEQLGGRRPDWIFGPSGYTNCLYGIFKSFQELKALELVDEGPRFGVAEIYGSLSQAMTAGSDTVAAAVVDRPTVAISMGTAQNAYQGLVVIRESNGSVSQVADEQILAAQKLLAENEGIFGETASVTGLAALIEQLEDGRVEREAEIVLILTSTGLKTLAVTADLEAKAPRAENVKEFVAVLRSEYGLNLDA
jgi:threonine synthase